MKQFFLKCWAYGCGCVMTGIILLLFVYVFWQGRDVISFSFLLDYPKGTPLGTAGGIFPAIVGSIFISLIAAISASICAIALALYMTYYCAMLGIASGLRFLVQCFSGIPSIVLGLFGYTFFLMHLGLPRSVLSAGLTLAIMIIPFIALRVEKILVEFPASQLQSSLALGVSLEYTIRHIVLPQRLQEIASTIALATAYAMGATAPIMFTGAVLYYGHVPAITDPFMALPYHLYVLANEGYSLPMAYGTAFVLMALVLGITVCCQRIGRRRM